MAIVKRISKRTGKASWQVVVSRTDPVTGKRVRTVAGTRATKGDARVLEAEALSQQKEGTLLDKSTATVSDLLTSWLATKHGTIKSNTHADYTWLVNHHLVPALGYAPMQAVSPPSVQHIVNEWKTQGKGIRTITSAYRVLSAAYDHAVALRLVAHNPCAGVALPSDTEPRTVPVWSETELQTFLAHIHGDTYEPLYNLLIETGIRLGEALGLHWESVNWETATIYIGPTAVPDKTHGGAMKIQQSGKTRSSRRAIVISPQLVTMLRDHRRKNMSTVLVFESENGKPLSHAWPRRKLKTLCEQSGVPVVRFHDLRHLAATRMVRAGVPEAVARQRMGHSSSAMLTRIYQHADADMQREAVAALTGLADRVLTKGKESTGNGNDSGDSGVMQNPVSTGNTVPAAGIEPTTYCSEDSQGMQKVQPKSP